MEDTIASRLKSIARERNLSQNGILKLVKPYLEGGSMGLSSIGHYMTGRSVPPDDKVRILARALDVDYEWLKNGDAESQAEPQSSLLEEKEKTGTASEGAEEGISSRIKAVMREQKISRKMLFERLRPLSSEENIGYSTLGFYLQGTRTNLSEPRLKALANALGVRYEWLKYGTGPRDLAGKGSSRSVEKKVRSDSASASVSEKAAGQAMGTEPAALAAHAPERVGRAVSQPESTGAREECRPSEEMGKADERAVISRLGAALEEALTARGQDPQMLKSALSPLMSLLSEVIGEMKPLDAAGLSENPEIQSFAGEKNTAKAEENAGGRPEASEKAGPQKAKGHMPPVRLILQSGEDKDLSHLTDRCLDMWAGMYRGSLEEAEEITIYLKPHENKAYWVVNGTDSGSVVI